MTALPTEITKGFVVGGFLLAVRDGRDADRFPDGVPAQGNITLTPLAPIRKTTAAPPKTIIKKPIECDLDPDGLLRLKALPEALDGPAVTFPPGVWLTTGQYNVTYDIAGSGLRPHDIEVTAAHTEAAPLDLTLASPPQAQLDPTQWSELNARMDALAGLVGTYDERIDGVELRIRTGTGSPQGVVTAAPGTRYLDTAATYGAGEWFKLSGTGTSGWVVVVGDTGLVDVTTACKVNDAAPITGDSVRVQRTTTGGLSLLVTVAGRTPAISPTTVTVPDWTRPGPMRTLASHSGGVPSLLAHASGSTSTVSIFSPPAGAVLALIASVPPATSATPWRTA